MRNVKYQRWKTDDMQLERIANNKQTYICSCILQVKLKRIWKTIVIVFDNSDFSTCLSPSCHEKANGFTGHGKVSALKLLQNNETFRGCL